MIIIITIIVVIIIRYDMIMIRLKYDISEHNNILQWYNNTII